jgi:hypothetical protein
MSMKLINGTNLKRIAGALIILSALSLSAIAQTSDGGGSFGSGHAAATGGVGFGSGNRADDGSGTLGSGHSETSNDGGIGTLGGGGRTENSDGFWNWLAEIF